MNGHGFGKWLRIRFFSRPLCVLPLGARDPTSEHTTVDVIRRTRAVVPPLANSRTEPRKRVPDPKEIRRPTHLEDDVPEKFRCCEPAEVPGTRHLKRRKLILVQKEKKIFFVVQHAHV